MTMEESLFVDEPNSPVEEYIPINPEPSSEARASPELDDNYGKELSEEQLDPIQLASIVKDLEPENDPMFQQSPRYMSEIVREMLQSDFLLVLGRGLGLSNILNLFVQQVQKHAPKALVLILGKTDSDDSEVFGNGMGSGDSENGGIVGFNTPASKRNRLYAQGGVYTVTAPIIVVDVLTGVLEPKHVSGLVVTRAEKVLEHSPAAFAIKLLKEGNPDAFFKALSDNPESMNSQITLPLRLRILNVKTVLLYPRFHIHVDESLPSVDVDEIIVEQPASVRRQQSLLSELISACLSDIKRRVPHLDVDFITPTFGGDQPQPMDNPDVLHSKTSADSFMAAPDLAYRIRNALSSAWHKLSAACKQSVSALSTLQQLERTLTHFDAVTFFLQLEMARQDTTQPWLDLPSADALLAESRNSARLNKKPAKYAHLRTLLDSIQSSMTADSQSGVLIMCSSLRTILGLQEYLSHPESDQANDGINEARDAAIKRAEEMRKKEAARKLEEAKNIGRPGRRRVRGAKSSTGTRAEDIARDSLAEPVEDANASNETSNLDLESELNSEFQTDLATQVILDPVEIAGTKIRATFATYASHRPIAEYDPYHIIMYDPDLTFTRECERYALNNKIEVHFMYYQQSVEELQYLTVMRREKDAFTKLIREKGIMPMVFDDAPADNDDFTIVGNKRSYQVSNIKPRVVVDIREFRSPLPQLVWQYKMDVIPMTLLVGDYILTPEIVVERKSISDLISSFRSGRLYTQCKSMLQHYKIAVVLIEFDSMAHFSMEPFKDIRMRKGTRIQREVQENIAALVLRFPKLKLIWSASPLHTAQIFKGLKEMEPEPDPIECLKAGQTVMLDSVAVSMLEALPGLTPSNSFLITKYASNFVELCSLSEEVIVSALGAENGGKLWRFLAKVAN